MADADNDGYGDNPNGFNGDQFLNDPLRWSDRDGDNYSDQENDDAFPLDPSQWADQDDGYGDNPNGTRPDAFPTDNTEWRTSTAMDTATTATSSDSMEVNGQTVTAMDTVTIQTAPMPMPSLTIHTLERQRQGRYR